MTDPKYVLALPRLQNVTLQFQDMVRRYGYRDRWWTSQHHHNQKSFNSLSPHYGVWTTCFVAFDAKHPIVHQVLDLWWWWNVHYTTQDQVGLSAALYQLRVMPYPLPDNRVWFGNFARNNM
eukprot:PhF_6_TR8293/c0_g3_i1/m.12757